MASGQLMLVGDITPSLAPISAGTNDFSGVGLCCETLLCTENHAVLPIAYSSFASRIVQSELSQLLEKG